MVSVPAPSVTVCEGLVVPIPWLEKVRLSGDAVKFAVDPWPVSVTLWGLPAELSVIVTVPLRVPMAVGVNVISRVQLPPEAGTLAQLFDWIVKSPLATMLETAKASVPRS